MHYSVNFLIRVLDFLRSRWRRSLSSKARLELNVIQDALSFKGEELGKCLRHLASAFSVNIASQPVCMEEWDEISQELKKLRKVTRRVATEAKARLEDFNAVFAPFILTENISRDIIVAEIVPFSKGLKVLEGKVAGVLEEWNAFHDRLGKFQRNWSSQISDGESFKGVETRVEELMLVNRLDDEMVDILKNTIYPGLMASLSTLLPTEISKRFYKDLLSNSWHPRGRAEAPDETLDGSSSLGHLPCLDGLINVSRMINSDLKSVDSASHRNSLKGPEWQSNINITLEVYSYFALSLGKFLESS